MTSRSLFLSAMFLVAFVTCMSALHAGGPRPKGDAADDAKLIRGTWIVIDLQQANHVPTKEEREFFKKGGYKITITGEKLIHSPDKGCD